MTITKHSLLAPAVSISAPFLSRLPSGWAWFCAYWLSHGEIHSIFINLIILVIYSIPGVITSFLISKKSNKLEVFFLYFIISITAYFLHKDNDLSSGITAGVRLIMAPFYTSLALVMFHVMVVILQRKR
jgi:hypothetical protein